MTLSIDSGQADLASKVEAQCVPLVVLETFSDRDAQTVDSTYYWTKGGPLNYEWDGATTSYFHPVLESVSAINQGFDHIPNGRVFDTREVVTLSLDATPRAGTYLWKTLLDETLIGARVTIASLMLDPVGAIADPRRFDITALGDVHAVRWRGEVTKLPVMSEDALTFDILCESFESPFFLERTASFFAQFKPDLGKRIPFIVGSANDVEAVRVYPGGVGTLAVALTTGSTVIDVYQLNDPVYQGTFLGGIKIKVDEEEFEALTVADQGDNIWRYGSLTPTNPASVHDVGTAVFEQPLYQFNAVSGQTCSALRAARLVQSDARAVQPNIRLENNYLIDPLRGPVALLMVNGLVAAFTADSDTYGNLSQFEMRADVDGMYTVGTTPTELWDFGDGGGSGASGWSSSSYPGGFTTAANITGGVEFTAEDEYSGMEKTITSVDMTNKELRMTINIPEDTLNDFISLQIRLGIPTIPALGDDAGCTITITSGMLAPDTDTEIRISGANTLPGADVTAITEIGFLMIFGSDDGVDRTFKFLGPVETYVTTPVPDHPTEVAELVVETLIDESQYTVDATTFATAKTNTPSVAIGGDISARGGTMGEILADLGYHGRTNFAVDHTGAASVVKAFNAKTTLDFTASVRTLETFTDLRLTSRELLEIANRFRVLYALNPSASAEDTGGYTEVLDLAEAGNPTAFTSKVANSVFTDSQTDFGIRPAAAVEFPMLNDQASVIEVFAYYASEAMRGKALRLSCLVPWWEGYDLERGDIVEIQPSWATTAIKCRITRTIFDFDRNGVGLNLEEVT